MSGPCFWYMLFLISIDQMLQSFHLIFILCFNILLLHHCPRLRDFEHVEPRQIIYADVPSPEPVTEWLLLFAVSTICFSFIALHSFLLWFALQQVPAKGLRFQSSFTCQSYWTIIRNGLLILLKAVRFPLIAYIHFVCPMAVIWYYVESIS